MIEIFWEKIVDRGIRKYKLTKISGFRSAEELPIEYLVEPPYILGVPEEGDVLDIAVFTGERTHALSYHDQCAPRFYLTVGAAYTEEQMAEVLKWMDICATKLSAINHKLKVENADWHGEGLFTL